MTEGLTKRPGVQRLPVWLRTSLKTDKDFAPVRRLLSESELHTVCESARCPNRHECWNRGVATFLILGNVCTRNCAFCAVPSGSPGPVDEEDPERVAAAVRKMRLRHVVVTSVTRDDLEDGGAELFVRTIQAVRNQCGETSIEVLTPDFDGNPAALARVLRAGPEVFSHNLETVRRLQKTIRPRASYDRSLEVLRQASAGCPGIVVKSGLMVGMGENEDEIHEAMRDLRGVGCDILTIGQYLTPSCDHAPVVRYVSPTEFDRYADKARDLGFKAVASAPLVRSSYHAEELLQQIGH